MRQVKVVFFDVDGVIVDIPSSWDYLHKVFGVSSLAKKVYNSFKQKKISYYEWMYLDTFLWIYANKGELKRKTIEKALEKIQPKEEYREIIGKLKEKSKRIVLLSGGISPLVERLSYQLQTNEWYANILVFDEKDRLIPGGIPVVPVGHKGKIIKDYLYFHKIEKKSAAFIGDSEWDKEGFQEVGLSIYIGNAPKYGACTNAYTPKEILSIIEKYEKEILECQDKNV